MKFLWNEFAWEEYLDWQKDKKKLKRINELLKDISRNGYSCKGKVERLSGDLSNYSSVRIDDKNRIVFRIIDNNIEILQCGTHYRDN